MLKQLNEEGAGLGAGTQAVLKGLDNPQLYRAAIVGALANFIEVNNEFIPAIEAALGQHLQTIFISDLAIAESIACALAEKKVGRAALRPYSVSAEAKRGATAGSSGWCTRLGPRPNQVQPGGISSRQPFAG